jgi:hypothetical protein
LTLIDTDCDRWRPTGTGVFGKELGRLREEAEEQEQRARRQKEEAQLLEKLEREKQVYEKRRARDH